jgi:hypothetical protein
VLVKGGGGPKVRKCRVRRHFEEFIGKDDFLVALSYSSVVLQCCKQQSSRLFKHTGVCTVYGRVMPGTGLLSTVSKILAADALR